MSETRIEKRRLGTLKEKGQYAMAFGVIGMMLFLAGFPVFLLFFVGILTFFIWKVFTAEGRTETRRIFEFYLSANEILREDERRWYGFEIQETITRGENIVRSMAATPPLVYFSLGALYQKLDDHGSAVKNLSHVMDENAPDETAIVYPARELREYVRMLRKIERTPAEAPLTSSAVRSLERARRNRGVKLLEQSRIQLASQALALPQGDQTLETIVDVDEFVTPVDGETFSISEESRRPSNSVTASLPLVASHSVPLRSHLDAPNGDRKTISEVLHDIYDKNVPGA